MLAAPLLGSRPGPRPLHAAHLLVRAPCLLHPQPRLAVPRRIQQQRRHPVTRAAAAVPADGGYAPSPAVPRVLAGPAKAIRTLLTPLSNTRANAKLLALCTAQMLGSVATLMVETYMPLYLSEVLHLTNTKIGNLQALTQFMAKASGSVSGTLADLLSPARMVIFGTLLTTINKPMFAASGWVYATLGTSACLYWITFAKVFDRVSKGVREAPSKALIGELAAHSGESPSAAFGLRHAMATLGMLLGALTAAAAFKLSGRNYELCFALSTIPGVLALVLVATAFRKVKGRARIKPEPGSSGGEEESTLSLLDKGRALLTAFQPAYWQALVVVGILYMARYDMSFGTLRAKTVMDKAMLPVLIPVAMVPQAVLATPAGIQAKSGARARNTVLVAGIAALIAANLAFAFMPSALGMMLGALFLGTHMAMTHGVSVGMLSTYIPKESIPGLGKISGTAWSFTDMVLGVVLAYSNVLAGRLADLTTQKGLGNIGCFLGGATASALSIVALLLFSVFGHLGRDDLLPAATKAKAA